jgi:hypothetical protein
MAIIKLSHLMAKVPAAKVNILNLSFELHEQLGLVIVEAELMVGDKEPEPAANLIIPLQLSTKEIEELLSVTHVPGSTRRRNLGK